jgi:hypothetical protein
MAQAPADGRESNGQPQQRSGSIIDEPDTKPGIRDQNAV